MELISPTDSMFLLAESREHPMHVGGLQLFEPPEDAGPEFIRDIYSAMLTFEDVQPTFRKHPGELFGGIANLAWSFDHDIDLEYHLRRSALPSPGRVRELLELTSRLHGTLLDRHRPLWEAHLVEGLNDGRFAVYTKVHHALVDGVSAMKMMRRALSDDPQDTDLRAPWNIGVRRMASAAEQLAANLNWGAFAKAEELKKRIWFTLGLLIIYRLGTYIPVPGIDGGALRNFMEQAQAGIGGILSMFTGGALGRMGIFALGIMPYISASIIVQLLASMVPALEQMKKEGEQGRKKINQAARVIASNASS